jgi:hypothetical protein
LFYNHIYDLLNACVSKYKPRKLKYPPWFSSDIIRNIRAKYRLLKQYKMNKVVNAFFAFKELRKRIKIQIDSSHKRGKSNIESDIQDNPKNFWRYVKLNRITSELPLF